MTTLKAYIYNPFLINHADIMVNKNVEYLFKYGLCLPSGSNLNDSDLERIINNIKVTFEK